MSAPTQPESRGDSSDMERHLPQPYRFYQDLTGQSLPIFEVS